MKIWIFIENKTKKLLDTLLAIAGGLLILCLIFFAIGIVCAIFIVPDVLKILLTQPITYILAIVFSIINIIAFKYEYYETILLEAFFSSIVFILCYLFEINFEFLDAGMGETMNFIANIITILAIFSSAIFVTTVMTAIVSIPSLIIGTILRKKESSNKESQ